MTIDGIDIVSMLRKFERPFAEAEGHPNLAGSYAVYCIDDQEAALLIHEEGQSANADLLECDCASPGCWPSQVTVERNNGTVRWNRFEQAHRIGKWNYDGFGLSSLMRRHMQMKSRNSYDARLTNDISLRF